MSGAPSVLYDAPGPKAKTRNLVYSVIFLVALAGLLWLILGRFNEKGQLDSAKWSPFVTDGSMWENFLLPGLGNTLLAAAISIVIALPLGAIFGIARLSDHAWIRIPAGAVVEFFRAIPVLILMIFANEFYNSYSDVEADVRPLVAVCTGLVLYNASVLAEVFRAGILSLPRGQSEASVALGMRKTQTMTLILLPQAVAVMLPAIVSQLVVILKDSALGGAILGFSELFTQIRLISSNYSNPIPTLIVVALIYIVINSILTWLANKLQKRLSRRRRPPRGTKADHMEQPVGPDPMAASTLNTGAAV